LRVVGRGSYINNKLVLLSSDCIVYVTGTHTIVVVELTLTLLV